MIPADILESVWPVLNFDVIDSTSVEASRRAGQGERGPLWIVAAKQSIGRGRLGRPWVSEPGNLYATALVPLEQLSDDVPCLALTVGLAVRDTLVDLSENKINPGVKWPNDVRIDGAKTSGILLESGSFAGEYWLSIGIGLNLAHAPEIENYKTTCLTQAADVHQTPETAINVLDRFLRSRVTQHVKKGRSSIIRDWLNVTDQRDGRCVSKRGGEIISGQFAGLDELGQLRMQMDDGEVVTITAGDVELVRENTANVIGN